MSFQISDQILDMREIHKLFGFKLSKHGQNMVRDIYMEKNIFKERYAKKYGNKPYQQVLEEQKHHILKADLESRIKKGLQNQAEWIVRKGYENADYAELLSKLQNRLNKVNGILENAARTV